MITTLIFDFGGVLINLDRQRCIDAFRQIGFPIADRLLDNYAQAGIFAQLENGDISLDDFHNGVRQLIGKPVTDADIDNALNAFLLDIPHEKLELLRQLRSKYRLLLLSNTNAIHFPHSAATKTGDGTNLKDYFDYCYLSYELHLSKPDPKIFTHLLDNEQLEASECLFLDDSPTNVQAAESVGINTILVPEGADLKKLLREYL